MACRLGYDQSGSVVTDHPEADWHNSLTCVNTERRSSSRFTPIAVDTKRVGDRVGRISLHEKDDCNSYSHLQICLSSSQL